MCQQFQRIYIAMPFQTCPRDCPSQLLRNYRRSNKKELVIGKSFWQVSDIIRSGCPGYLSFSIFVCLNHDHTIKVRSKAFFSVILGRSMKVLQRHKKNSVYRSYYGTIENLSIVVRNGKIVWKVVGIKYYLWLNLNSRRYQHPGQLRINQM